MNSKQHINRGLLWGQLLAYLDTAKRALDHAGGGGSLLPGDDRELLDRTRDQLIGLLQRAWVIKEAETYSKPAKPRSSRGSRRRRKATQRHQDRSAS